MFLQFNDFWLQLHYRTTTQRINHRYRYRKQRFSLTGTRWRIRWPFSFDVHFQSNKLTIILTLNTIKTLRGLSHILSDDTVWKLTKKGFISVTLVLQLPFKMDTLDLLRENGHHHIQTLKPRLTLGTWHLAAWRFAGNKTACVIS